ncbi:MAG: hypothetical protein EBW75_03440 [Actinobacteria bacterium]|nr:hypothetical protein [Actinomycetota bacterium]NCW76053.1 hypothetical protein [Actinomycetota bacterium]NCW94778.1 hypothetical protein [Actinomycetota bacterium]NCX00659.1 hypothetical protein [Actinomycetota bacterium]NCX33359.1 hypothetical protein [Actinomycetota bacterium]
MRNDPSIQDIKARWNDVLDALERKDRVAWLAYFDGRLVSFEGGVLTLDFSDPNKFEGGHDYSKVRLERFRPALEEELKEIFGVVISVQEIS